MSKFGSLIARVDKTFRVELPSPKQAGKLLKDKDGKVAYIDVLSSESEAARKFDREFQEKLADDVAAGITEFPAQIEVNKQKCAALVTGWYLVDPETRDAIDIPFSPENAKELLTDPGAAWLFYPVWLGANKTANFMERPSEA